MYSCAPVFVGLDQLEPFAASQQRTVLEHIQGSRVQGPVRALARSVRHPRDFHKTVVERQVVPERVLPPLRVPSVVRELVADELVDVGQRKHFLRRTPYGHGRQ